MHTWALQAHFQNSVKDNQTGQETKLTDNIAVVVQFLGAEIQTSLDSQSVPCNINALLVSKRTSCATQDTFHHMMS